MTVGSQLKKNVEQYQAAIIQSQAGKSRARTRSIGQGLLPIFERSLWSGR